MTDVIREMPSEGVVLLQLNRPQAMNALNLSIRSELAKWIVEADADDATKVIVITGMQSVTGYDRYRPSLRLRRRALLARPIHERD